MKKIDLHIHTIPTVSDAEFVFSLDTFKKYVIEARLDAVAITNHDIFDVVQFKQIEQALETVVFPGIEINVDSGHVLVICESAQLSEFAAGTTVVSQRIKKSGDRITVEELVSIFPDIKNYLVIPHFDKAPPMRGEALEKLRPYMCGGEVDSAKKFVRFIKDESKPTPLLFSDERMKVALPRLPTRQTFIDCGDVTIAALKACLQDKTKVALSEKDGNRLWQVFENGQMLSTGLNVLLGARSSGKTYTLDKISESAENVKYIRQFSLVQQTAAESEKEFKSEIERKRSVFVDEYLSGFKRVLDDMMNVDIDAQERAVERYLETLLKSAEEADRMDAFSKAKLFDEVDFPIGSTDTLKSLIESVRQVIENIEFREVIERHVQLSSLKTLALELIELFWNKTLESDKKKLVNSLVKEVKQGLRVMTSATQVEDVDLYHVFLDKRRIHRFCDIVNILKTDAVIFEESLQGFKIEARRGSFKGAMEIKAASRVNTAFSEPFRCYADPYRYLRALLKNDSLQRAELYKLFSKITYKILNEDGFEVSGGERSEFRLLQEISDAQNYDVLLIDEPESSFDNVFLKSDVNKIIKAISEAMPVIVVTHNNTVGASVGADFLLFTRKEIDDGSINYRMYAGYPTDKKLYSSDGRTVSSHEIMMNSLEAGFATYVSRRDGYEAIKD